MSYGHDPIDAHLSLISCLVCDMSPDEIETDPTWSTRPVALYAGDSER